MLVTATKLGVRLAGQIFGMGIVQVQCLKGRVRPLLKCPRAHEGTFQSLYFRGGEVACRHCHRLRYRSKVVASAADRVRLARLKWMANMGGTLGCAIPGRQPYKWRRRYQIVVCKLACLTAAHYSAVRVWLRNHQGT